MLEKGNAWASKTLLTLQQLQQGLGRSTGLTPTLVAVEWSDMAGVVEMLERYFALSDADAKRRQQARAAASLGGRVVSEAKLAALRIATQRASEARSRKAALRRQQKAAEQLASTKPKRKRK